MRAGKALVEEGKESLGVTTLTKAEKYLERAIAQERIAAQKGKKTATFLEKLEKATKKHEEVLLELKEKAAVEDLLRYPREGYERIKEILNSKH